MWCHAYYNDLATEELSDSMLADSSYGTLIVKRIGGMLMENSNIEIIGGGLLFTEIEVQE